jgi:hypothetical protein
LNQLNIDVRSGVGESAVIGIPDSRIRVILEHTQVLRPSTPIPIAPDLTVLETHLLTEFPLLHENNKLITRELLTEEIQDRIKVNR